MNVLNVNAALGPVSGGGTGERTFQMTRFLQKSDVNCTVLVTNAGLSSERRNSLGGAKVVAYPCLSTRFYIPKFSYKEIRSLVQGADIVHLMGHWTFLNALVYLIARGLGKPYVVCPAGALRIYGRSKNLKKIYNEIFGKRIIRNANACVAISKSDIEDFGEYGVADERVFLIPNGIDYEAVPPADVLGFQSKYGLEGKRFVLFMGRLNNIKGPDLLLEAFGQLKEETKDYQLVFVGSDEGMLDLLIRLASQHRIDDRVHFLGYIGGKDKYQAYYAADLLVIPSRREAMSIVVLEAGAVGTPVLLTEECGFSEITDIGGGRVVPCSVEGLKEGLRTMLGQPRRSKDMGLRLQRYVRDCYSWSRIVRRYIKLYAEISGTRQAK